MEKTTISQATTQKTDDDLNYENIINIYKMIIPDEIEESYVKLTETVQKYTGTHRNSKDWATFKKKMSALVSKKNEHSQIEKSLQEKIAALTEKGAEDPKIYEEIILLTRKAESEHFAAKKAEEEIEEAKKYFNSDLKETGIDEKAYVGEIIQLLQTIKGQKFDIDNLDLEKYINIIDSFNIDDKQKKLLKSILSSYVSLRISIFRKMEELAQTIVNAYEQNTFLDLNMLTAENATYLIALTAGDINIGESLQESALRNINSQPLYNNILDNQALTMRIISDYIDNGKLDKVQVEELLKSSMDFEYKNILSMLQNTKNIGNTMDDELISEDEVGRSR